MKRKYSEKQMSLLMQEYEASQLSSDAFAAAKSIPKSTFYRWKIRYQQSLEQLGEKLKVPEFNCLPVSAIHGDVRPDGGKRKEIEALSAANIGRRLIITTPNGLRLELDV